MQGLYIFILVPTARCLHRCRGMHCWWWPLPSSCLLCLSCSFLSWTRPADVSWSFWYIVNDVVQRQLCFFFPKTCATWAFISIERCGYRLLDDLQWQWPTSVAIDDGHHCGESAESLFLAVASVALQQFLRHSLWNWSPDTLKFKMHHDLDDPVKRKYVGLDATLNKHF